MKNYELRRYLPFKHPFYLNTNTDAILIDIKNFTDLTFGGPSFGQRPSTSTIRGITRALGVSFECFGSNFYGDALRFLIWEYLVFWKLCDPIEEIGTLQSLAIVHPLCLFGLGNQISADLQERKTNWEQKQSNNGREKVPWTVPTLTFQAYDCSLSRQHAESQLRALMEQQMSTS